MQCKTQYLQYCPDYYNRFEIKIMKLFLGFALQNVILEISQAGGFRVKNLKIEFIYNTLSLFQLYEKLLFQLHA